MANKLNKLKKRLHKTNQQLARGEYSEKSVLDIMDEVERELFEAAVEQGLDDIRHGRVHDLDDARLLIENKTS